jgi:hypothetical protein
MNDAKRSRRKTPNAFAASLSIGSIRDFARNGFVRKAMQPDSIAAMRTAALSLTVKRCRHYCVGAVAVAETDA